MSNETQTTSQADIAVAMILSAWHAQNKKLDALLDKLPDEQFLKETAPGRNRGIYLLGHLAAVNDAMLPILGLGEKLYPQLEKIFITDPDNTAAEMPPVATLKDYWKKVNDKLSAEIAKMKTADWFSRHTLVSAEDFVKEPQRNKLNIMVSRANHQGYHLGQLAYLDVKKAD